MLFLVIIGILAALGIVSSLPLKASLYSSILILIGGLSYYVIVPIIEHGVFLRGFFLSALIVVTLFIWVAVDNSRAIKAERIRQDKQ